MATMTEPHETEQPSRREWIASRVRRLNASALNAMDDPHRIWVVATAAPQREFISQGELAGRGSPTFVPAVTHVVKASPYSNRRLRVARPLISQMLFVGVPADCERVHALLRLGFAQSADDRPGAVLEVDGAALRSFVERNRLRDRDDVTELMRRHARFTIGEPVDVISGPFTGQPATLTALRRDRAWINVAIFGTVSEIELPLDAIRELA